MPRFDLITGITLHQLEGNALSDRRGRMITCHLADIPNLPYAAKKAIVFLQTVILTLADHYEVHHMTPTKDGKVITNYWGTEGEQNECWIYSRQEESGPVVYIRHKYWSQEMVDAFYELMKVYAKLHKWTVKDEVAEAEARRLAILPRPVDEEIMLGEPL